MQLLFIWVKEYKCLENAKMNFCEYPRFDYIEDENKLIQISKKSPSKTIFPLYEYNCIDNISVIVGSNGSGKTTICSLLGDIFFNEYNKSKYIVVYRIGNNLFYKTNYTDINVYVPQIKKQNHHLSQPDFHMVYYSPFYTVKHPFDQHIYNPKSFIDCSTSYVLKHDLDEYRNSMPGKKYNSSIDLLKANKIMDNNRCISFLVVKDELYKKKDKFGNPIFKLGTTLPEKVVFTFDKNIFDFFETEKSGDFDELVLFYEKLRKYVAPETNRKQNFIDNCALAMFCSYTRDWITNQFTRKFPFEIKEICNALNPMELENYSVANLVQNTFEDIYSILKKINGNAIFVSICKSIIKFINYLIDKFDDSCFRDDKIFLDIKQDSNKINDLYMQYQQIVKITGFGIFDYLPLQSSGEFSEMLIYGRLFDGMQFLRNQRNPKHVVLFFDEVEVTLHPELQRQMILNICVFLQTFYQDTKFQIFFSTHSPVILSDIPKINVVFLEKREGERKSKVNEPKINTFAGNVGEMYYEHFFMKKTIGALAENEIKRVFELIKNGKGKESKCIIEYIGDELLRKVLLNKMDDKNG